MLMLYNIYMHTSLCNLKELQLLTSKQKAFVVAYAEKRNGTEAARIAGYKGSNKTLAQVAHENLKKPDILKAYDAYMRPRLDEAGINTQRTLQHLADIAYAPWKDFIHVPGFGEATVRLGDKLRALAQLCDIDPNIQSIESGNTMHKPHLNFHYEPGKTPEENRKVLFGYLRHSSVS